MIGSSSCPPRGVQAARVGARARAMSSGVGSKSIVSISLGVCVTPAECDQPNATFSPCNELISTLTYSCGMLRSILPANISRATHR